jgi:branched-chain amino acid aminotransferase
MLNFNGGFIEDSHPFAALNRGFLFADAVFETIRIQQDKVLFTEDHYFRLMAAMRIIRMEIPMEFTMEFLEGQWLETARKNQFSNARIRMTVFRNAGGLYTPKDRSVSWTITASALDSEEYTYVEQPNEVELFKDFHIAKHLLSTIKTTSKTLHVTAGIFAKENGYQNCLLINEDKNVVEAINGNVFILKDNELITPPVSEGCVNGVMRKQILAIAKKMEQWEVVEKPISPFDLQKSDEIFITNVISGVFPVTKYRKKEFTTDAAQLLIDELRALVG